MAIGHLRASRYVNRGPHLPPTWGRAPREIPQAGGGEKLPLCTLPAAAKKLSAWVAIDRLVPKAKGLGGTRPRGRLKRKPPSISTTWRTRRDHPLGGGTTRGAGINGGLLYRVQPARHIREAANKAVALTVAVIILIKPPGRRHAPRGSYVFANCIFSNSVLMKGERRLKCKLSAWATSTS